MGNEGQVSKARPPRKSSIASALTASSKRKSRQPSIDDETILATKHKDLADTQSEHLRRSPILLSKYQRKHFSGDPDVQTDNIPFIRGGSAPTSRATSPITRSSSGEISDQENSSKRSNSADLTKKKKYQFARPSKRESVGVNSSFSEKLDSILSTSASDSVLRNITPQSTPKKKEEVNDFVSIDDKTKTDTQETTKSAKDQLTDSLVDEISHESLQQDQDNEQKTPINSLANSGLSEDFLQDMRQRLGKIKAQEQQLTFPPVKELKVVTDEAQQTPPKQRIEKLKRRVEVSEKSRNKLVLENTRLKRQLDQHSSQNSRLHAEVNGLKIEVEELRQETGYVLSPDQFSREGIKKRRRSSLESDTLNIQTPGSIDDSPFPGLVRQSNQVPKRMVDGLLEETKSHFQRLGMTDDDIDKNMKSLRDLVFSSHGSSAANAILEESDDEDKDVATPSQLTEEQLRRLSGRIAYDSVKTQGHSHNAIDPTDAQIEAIVLESSPKHQELQKKLSDLETQTDDLQYFAGFHQRQHDDVENRRKDLFRKLSDSTTREEELQRTIKRLQDDNETLSDIIEKRTQEDENAVQRKMDENWRIVTQLSNTEYKFFQQVHNLESEIESLKTQRDKERTQHQQTANEREVANQTISQQEKEIKALRDELETKREEYRTKLTQSFEDKQDVKKQLKRRESDHDSLDNEHEELKRKWEYQKHLATTYKEQRESFKEQAAIAQSTNKINQSEIERLQTDNNSFSSKLRSAKEAEKSLSAKMLELEATIEQLEAEALEKKKDEAEMRALRKKNARLEEEALEHASTDHIAFFDLAETKRKSDVLLKEKEQLEKEHKKYKALLEDKETHHQEEIERIERAHRRKVREMAAELVKNMYCSRAMKTDLEQSLKDAELEIQGKDKIIKDREEEIKDVNEERKADEQRQQELEDELESQQKASVGLRVKLNQQIKLTKQATSEVNDLRQQASTVKEEHDAAKDDLETQLTQSRQNVASLNATNRRLIDDSDKLKRSLQQSKEEAARAKEDAAKAKKEKVMIHQPVYIEKEPRVEVVQKVMKHFEPDYEAVALQLFGDLDDPTNKKVKQITIDYYRYHRKEIHDGDPDKKHTHVDLKDATDGEVMAHIKADNIRAVQNNMAKLVNFIIDNGMNEDVIKQVPAALMSTLLCFGAGDDFKNYKEVHSKLNIRTSFCGEIAQDSKESQIRNKAMQNLLETIDKTGPLFGVMENEDLQDNKPKNEKPNTVVLPIKGDSRCQKIIESHIRAAR